MVFTALAVTMLLSACSMDETISVPEQVTYTTEDMPVEGYVLDPTIKLNVGDTLALMDYLFLPNVTISEMTVMVTVDNQILMVDAEVAKNLSSPASPAAWEELPSGLSIYDKRLFAKPVILPEGIMEVQITLLYTIRQRDMTTPKGWIEKKETMTANKSFIAKSNEQAQAMEMTLTPDLIPPTVPLFFNVGVDGWQEVVTNTDL